MIRIFGGTDVGKMRSANQDAYTLCQISDDLAFAILCDGMGGENGGDIASRLAVGHAEPMLRRELKNGMSEMSLRSILESAVAGANAIIYQESLKDTSLSGMGTTMIISVLSSGFLYIMYVGDSRVYLVSDSEERRLTKDHTVVQMLVDIGEISEADALVHPQRHYITKAVGVSPAVDPDFIVEKISSGDKILICSDGLYNYLLPGKTHEILAECVASESTAPLIALANNSGGSDNITAVVIA